MAILYRTFKEETRPQYRTLKEETPYFEGRDTVL